MNIVRSAILASILLAVATLVPATASADSGFYVGGGIGNAGFDIDLGEAEIPEFDEFDENDMGYKVFGGFTFDLPVVILGIELAYTDFGTPSMDVLDQSLAISVDGLNLMGIVGFSAGPVDLYAKYGTLEWDATLSAAGNSESIDGSDTGYGVGLRFDVASVQIRGEYEVFELDSAADLTMFSIGVAYNF